MQNRPVWFTWGSARVPRVNASPARTFGVVPKQSFLNARGSSKSVAQEKCTIARRARQHPRRMRYPLACFSLAAVISGAHAQEPTPTPSPSELEAEPIVVTATRFDIPLELSPASVSVINSEDFEQKQIERVSDEVLKTVLSKTATLKAWQENHESDLHTAAEIDAQLEKVFGHVIREQAACYFRYAANAISTTEKRNAILEAFAQQEEALSAEGSIVALGRRFVAERGKINSK